MATLPLSSLLDISPYLNINGSLERLAVFRAEVTGAEWV